MLIFTSIYQEYLAKTLTDKYGNLNMEMDRIINEANSEIDNLTQKLSRIPATFSSQSRQCANLKQRFKSSKTS